jgi:prepilin-type processing-associated H-X9-DG protein
MLLPALSAAKAKALKIGCLNNLKQITLFTQMYTDDGNDTFPTCLVSPTGTWDPGAELTNWWGTLICGGSTNNYNSFHDPAVKSSITENGVTWSWAFNFNLVGYGYNSFFLDCTPNPAGDSVSISGYKLTSAVSFKRCNVRHPTDCLVFGDKQPKGPSSNPTASGSLYWKYASMVAPSASGNYEGIDTIRHNNLKFPGSGNVGFADGHAESKSDANINPPADPSGGTFQSLGNSKFWDPLQRGP